MAWYVVDDVAALARRFESNNATDNFFVLHGRYTDMFSHPKIVLEWEPM